MQTPYLFVYGSLMSGFRSHAYEYISSYFTFVGEATVQGTIYDMGDFPAARPTDTGRLIKGELYRINSPAEFAYAMAQLDDYEGLHPEDGEEIYFEREISSVFINGEALPAWVYWYNREIYDKPVVESGDLRDYLKNHG
ncbi:MAG: gamma-glutamylcyclotransferase family protein [Niabella sp.]